MCYNGGMLRNVLNRSRWFYGLLIVFLMLSGLFSRWVSGVPLWLGDALWAMLIYAGLRLLLVNRSKSLSLGLAVLICYGVEFSQLIQEPWLVAIRQMPLGHLVLGQGFLWSDLVAYSVGLVLIWRCDTSDLLKRRTYD